MRQSKFAETQIVALLKEADAGRPVNEIWRKYGISSATYYKWKAKYGGLEASDVKRLKELAQENSRLKRLYADLSLENAALKEVLAKKVEGPLSGVRPWFRWCATGSRFSVLAGLWGWPAPRTIAPGGVGAAGGVGHRGPHHAGGRQAPLGLLEVFRPPAARWTGLES